MAKLFFSSCLAVLLFSVSFCHAQTNVAASSFGEVFEKILKEDIDCDGWETIAANHWNNRVYRLQWKYPDAPWFGSLPEKVKAFVVRKYCEDGVDWVSENPAVVRDIMERKWPAGMVK